MKLTVWTTKTDDIPNGHRFQRFRDLDPVSFRSYLMLLEKDQDFGSWYTDLLAGADYEAFFWEHPPLHNTNIDTYAEFELLDSPALARLSPDPEPFRPRFESDDDIASFPSLGGDALLIAPGPCEPLAACTHLAAFVRKASRTQVRELWHETGRAMRETLSDRNLWLSTSGLGVAWLHIRLDSHPKYYQHRPYAATQVPFGLR